MKFSSTQKDIRTLLTSGYYKVPRFQRPYSWAREELDELWSDVLVEGEPGYFLGSIVAFTDGPADYGIVDGQQRLITSTILLCCIRDAFAREGLPKLSDGLHQTIIERPDLKSLTKCVLQPETSAEYFYETIQKRGGSDAEAEREPEGEEERTLRAAHTYLASQVAAAIEAIRSDPTIKDEDQAERIKEKLEEMRDKLLEI